jgi:hypothetical protein
MVANLLKCAPADLELREGRVGAVGVPGAAVRLAEVARPVGKSSLARGQRRPRGDVLLTTDDLCRARCDRRGRPRTGRASIDKYAVAMRAA